MIARWPGRIAPQQIANLPATHYDALATIADIVGVAPVEPTDGVSYWPTLRGDSDAQRRREYLFWDFAGYGGQLAVRLGSWKGVKRDVRKNADAPLQLYDLTSDIGERQSVTELHPDVSARMEEIMLEAREKPEVEKFRFGRYRDE
jgi:arylsulfatase A-like enzyme